MATANKLTYLNETKNQLRTNINALGGDLTEEDTFRSYANELDNMWEELPHSTGEGETLSLNTKKGKMKLTLKGNTSQYTTTGKNLLNQSEYISTKTTNAVKFTNNGDGTFNVSGTASASFTWNILDIGDITLESGKTYTLYSSIPYNGNTFNLSIPYKQDGTQKYLTANNSVTTSGTITDVKLALYIPSGTNVSVTNVKLMLVEGSTAGDYEPYTGGASPNPSYPQDVHIVSGDNTINICGKNLINEENKSNTWCFSNGTIQPAIGGNLVKIKCQANDKISIFATFSNASAQGIILVAFYDENNNLLTRNAIANNTNPTMTRTAPTNTSYAYAGHYLDAPTQIQVQRGEPTTYEPYQSQSYSVNLGTLELCKIGNYQDYLYKDSGKWYLHKEINKVVLDGTNVNEYVNYLDATTYSVPRMQLLKSNLGFKSSWDTGIVLLNKYSEITTTGDVSNGTFALNFQQAYINIFDSRATDIATARNIVIGTEIYIIKATPTTEEITNTTLISQLDALETAMSYKGQTNISQINNDLPFNIDAKIKVGN